MLIVVATKHEVMTDEVTMLDGAFIGEKSGDMAAESLKLVSDVVRAPAPGLL